MLSSLNIRNFIIAHKLDLEFKSGLCVITGETGAGKSILLDAIIFGLGGKTSTKVIRPNYDHASVTLEFTSLDEELIKLLQNNDINLDDGVLIVRRTIHESGKTRVFLNDNNVTLSLLKQISEYLLEIHGQNAQITLLNESNNILLLDEFSDNYVIKQATRESYKLYKKSADDLADLVSKIDKLKSEEDYLVFVINELEKLDAKEGEENLLQEKRLNMQNNEKILGNLVEAANLIKKNEIMGKLNIFSNQINKAAKFNDKFTEFSANLDKAIIDIEDIAAYINNYIKEFDFDEQELNLIEERLFLLRNIARKYHITPDEIHQFYLKIKDKLSVINNFENNIKTLEEQYNKAKDNYLKASDALSVDRHKQAKIFEQQIKSELIQLKMEKCYFSVEIEKLSEQNFSQNGVDKIVFMASTNPGIPPAPLNKIASGGEISRLMLAIKVIAPSKSYLNGSAIFDEIDSGVGGAVADAVGSRLKKLSQKGQVIVITHQPQVAVKADLHLHVTKTHEHESTQSNVKALNDEQRQEEIARMISGADISQEARLAAQKLLAS